MPFLPGQNKMDVNKLFVTLFLVQLGYIAGNFWGGGGGGGEKAARHITGISPSKGKKGPERRGK